MSTTTRTRAMSPARFQQFFDQPFTATMGSVTTLQQHSASTYNPATSWNGQSDDPTPFSRLKAGYRVNELSPTGAGDIFGQAPKSKGVLPTIDAINVLGGAAVPQEGSLVILDDESFSIGGVSHSKARAIDEPAVLKKAEHLLTPADRREIMLFEKAKLKADRVKQQAVLQKQRMDQIMRARHPDGCIGVDSPATTNSDVYKEKSQQLQEKMEKKKQASMKRQETLVKHLRSASERGFDILTHSEELKSPAELKFMPAKNTAQRPELNTHERLFLRPSTTISIERMQKVRDEDLRGKSYNLITGARIEICPPSIPERVNKQFEFAHPSVDLGAVDRS